MKMPAHCHGGWLCHAGALSIMCALLASCTLLDTGLRTLLEPELRDVSRWKAAGNPVVVSCDYPFKIDMPAPSGNMGPQAYTSMHDFLQAAAAAQAPILLCYVIGGSDAEPDAAQIAGAGWDRLGYIHLRAWRPVDATAHWEYETEEYVMNSPMGGPVDKDYYANPSYSLTFHKVSYDYDISSAYGAWYLAYQLIPQDNAQATRQGAGLYAMQGFWCAIQMRDFPAARQHWAQALKTNPESAAAYAQVALKSFFLDIQNPVLNKGSVYLNVPQDIRRAVWDAAGQSYSGEDGTSLSMAQVENAAQAGAMSKILLRRVYAPKGALLYCPVFYPDFDPLPFYEADYKRWKLSNPFFLIPGYRLRYATERAAREAKKNAPPQKKNQPQTNGGQ